ncbi:hypothetical protein [Methyloceanibacter stevinii]|uniref:hypothetical protein n=1 Tax=Methyloceanibacter stevinii TaxID=1774970 RepID=UPI001300FD63|nr:hypothetical protein [Methyloceanibacter stevinii]
MFASYILVALVWAVVVAAVQPPLIVGALLVAIPVIVIGCLLGGPSKAKGAS